METELFSSPFTFLSFHISNVWPVFTVTENINWSTSSWIIVHSECLPDTEYFSLHFRVFFLPVDPTTVLRKCSELGRIAYSSVWNHKWDWILNASMLSIVFFLKEWIWCINFHTENFKTQNTHSPTHHTYPSLTRSCHRNGWEKFLRHQVWFSGFLNSM